MKDGCLLRQASGVSRPDSESASARERRLWPRLPHVEPLRFRRTPLLAAALCFAAGEGLTRLPPANPRLTLLLFAGTLSLVALTMLALRHADRVAVPAVLALWLGAGLWSAQLQPSPAPQTELVAYADGLSRTVQGRIVRIRTLEPRSQNGGTSEPDSDLDQWDQSTQPPATSLDIEVSAVEDVTPELSRMVAASGGIRVTLFAGDGPLPALRCGEVVEMPVRLRLPERYRDPGAWQYADYLLEQNIAATGYAAQGKLRVLADTQSPQTRRAPDSLRCETFAAQSWAAARLAAYVRSPPNLRLPPLLRLTPDDGGMLNAMLFGDRSRLSHSLRIGFERTGSFHLFVVSGMHVALLAGIVFYLSRRLLPGARGHPLNDWGATGLTLVLISVYALLTGFGVPVQRALLMTSVFLAARLLSRDRNPMNALGAAALAVLVPSPRALFEASFQMTFLAIVAIAGIAIPLAERSFLPYARAARSLHQMWRDTSLPPRLAQFRVMLRLWSDALDRCLSPLLRHLPAGLIRAGLYAAELALIGLVAEAVMVLPMALTFHRATVYALPANLLSIPLVGVLAPLGLLTFLLSLISPYLGAVPAAALAVLLHSVTGTIQLIGHAQAADLRVAGPNLAHALQGLACFAFCCWATRRSGWLAIAAAGALPLAAVLILWPLPPALHPGQLEVTAIDVGQGDSIVVVSPNGQTMLIDAGGPTGAAANAENAAGLISDGSGFDVGEEVVSPYLWSRQMRGLDVVALTHAHSDHMGGMLAVLRNFRPRELWVGVDPDSMAYEALLAEAAALGIRVRHLRAGDYTVWGGVSVAVLAPAPGYANPGPPINNDSLVLRLQYGASSVLLEGDAEAPSEHAMVENSRVNPKARIGPDTLLKVGHHGSRTSTTPEFLALVAPREAIISVGRGNTFGHPRPEIVDRLAQAHVQVFRTDRFGLTTFLLGRDGSIAAVPYASLPR